MARLCSVLFFCAFALWLGASVMRLVVGYDAFVPGTTVLKSWYTPLQLGHDMWLYALMAAWVGWSFCVMMVGGFGMLLLQHKEWKNHAWMVMILIFLLLLLPAQWWIISNDFTFWELFDSQTGLLRGDATLATGIFAQRITGTAYSVINGLTILTGFTIAGTLAIRPLTKHS